MAPDPNEQLAFSFNAANIIEEIRSEKLPDNQRLAETFLIMLMPKGKHKLTDFWTKPETFIRKIVPFLIRFPIVHDNMMKAVARDHRLSSQAGVCGIDFAAVISELGPLLDPSEMEEAGVKASHIKGQKFKDQLRNNYGSANGPLPLLAIYNGLAKLVLRAIESCHVREVNCVSCAKPCILIHRSDLVHTVAPKDSRLSRAGVEKNPLQARETIEE